MNRNNKIAKRFALAALATTLALTASACGGSSGPETAEGETANIHLGYYVGGAPSLTSQGLVMLGEDSAMQEAHGIKLQMEEYSNLSTMYTDIVRGRIDVSTAGPSTVASSASQGAPVAIVGKIANATNSAMSTGKPWDADNVRGSRIVTQTSSSSWKSVEASIANNLGLQSGQDYEVINSDSTAAAAVQAATGKADYAIVRAEQILLAEQQFPTLKVVADASELGIVPGKADIGYVLESNTNGLSSANGEKLTAALAEKTAWMEANPDAVEDFAVARGQKPGIAREFLVSGTISYDVQPVSEARGELEKEFEALEKAGIIEQMPPDSIYG
ncbi:hypothetical protein E5720_18960 [Rhodococcus sp. PAMC28707]|uniref:ABC transporter substrate-binding protein n=1 Tax=unclassified Rhodococcus (in: high G+C Gram-positive bacteria) TaxID=192944 RepID=UPI00109DF36F|nr:MULTISPECIES: ABC transporter substrate-binding protein [unclassified Rhodococcus (in: high G+C Gram-positive bacteria)]QCB51586.1 hypothetical protein E5769_16565 [Rhodococcus sp. PAMC28705]QCB60246.1 hypothetical protein E5720_18960 [Rhodococcus sp. PAMC28707]